MAESLQNQRLTLSGDQTDGTGKGSQSLAGGEPRIQRAEHEPTDHQAISRIQEPPGFGNPICQHLVSRTAKPRLYPQQPGRKAQRDGAVFPLAATKQPARQRRLPPGHDQAQSSGMVIETVFQFIGAPAV